MRHNSFRNAHTRSVITVRLALTLTAVPALAGAQEEPRIIKGDPVCPKCTAQLTRVLSMGDEDGPGALAGDPYFLVRLRDGRFVTAEYPVATRVLVFKPDGSFDRQLGRKGKGPGEFEFATAAYVAADGRLHVVDYGNARELVYNDKLEIAETIKLPQFHPSGVAAGPNGTVYYNASPPGRSLRHPIHKLADGAIAQSFGSPIKGMPGMPHLSQRAMAPVPGGLWIAPRTHYQLEHWTSAGQPAGVLERKVDWFEPYLMRGAMSASDPIEPWVAGLRHAGGDVLHVLVSVVASDFPKRLRVREKEGSKTTYYFDNCSDFYDTMIEAIDVKNGQLLSSSRWKGCLSGFVGDMIYGSRTDEAGVPRIDIYKLSLPTRQP